MFVLMNLKEQNAEVIKYLRGVHKLTQEDLSERSGLAISTIRSIEGGAYLPRIDTVLKLAKAFDIDPSHLILPLWEYQEGKVTKAVEVSRRLKHTTATE